MFLVPFTTTPRTSSLLNRSFERLFDDSFERLAGFGTESEVAQRSPALDVAESERGYSVDLDLPGVAKDDIKIAIDGRRVSVSAQAQRDETRKDGERVIYRERSTASFARTFALPEEIDQEASQAKLDNGVLSLTLAKKRATAARTLTVN
jgi:HSP20 family protein